MAFVTKKVKKALGNVTDQPKKEKKYSLEDAAKLLKAPPRPPKGKAPNPSAAMLKNPSWLPEPWRDLEPDPWSKKVR